MPQHKPIRSLERGLDILDALHALGSASLGELHRRTGLPKASLLRMLRTLEARHYIRRSLDRAAYELDVAAMRGSASPEQVRLAQAAAPVLRSLLGKMPWPSDIAVYRDGAMRIVETSRALAPVRFPRVATGLPVVVTPSAIGRAYLAFAPPRRRAAIIARLARSTNPAEAAARHPATLLPVLREVAASGYATRAGAVEEAAIAVPILAHGEAVGAINILWKPAAAKPAEIAGAHLVDLQEAAGAISERLVNP